MAVINATEARRDFFDLIKRALHMHEPIRVTHRDGSVVLVAEDDYESLLETLELLSAPGFRQGLAEAEADVERGRVKSVDEVLGNG